MANECWYCLKDVGFESDAELEKHCVNCGVLNDRNPYLKTEPPKEEEEMDLKNWSKDNAKFIKIKSGESYEGKYLGSKPGVNMNGEPAVVYNLDGKEFKSSSTILADKFSTIPEGTQVKISRDGEGLQTKWKVETL